MGEIQLPVHRKVEETKKTSAKIGFLRRNEHRDGETDSKTYFLRLKSREKPLAGTGKAWFVPQ